MTSFLLEMHPASEGDCLTLSWGESKQNRALIDLGRTKDYTALLPRLRQNPDYALFVITHIDADHIEGALPFAKEDLPAFEPREVWFNAYHHLVEARDRTPQQLEMFGAVQGEKLSRAILKFGWRNRWNATFAGGPVSTGTPLAATPINLPGHLSISLLSPDDQSLAALEPTWLKELMRTNLRPTDLDKAEEQVSGEERFGGPNVEALAQEQFVEDEAKPNGSSIAFIAKYAGKLVLLGGDAHPGVMAAALKRAGVTPENPLKVEVCKLAHHGSKANTSPELLALIDCRRYAFSTNGTRHNHPDPQTIARILKQEQARRKQDPARPATELIFNFRQRNADLWNSETLRMKYNYSCILPEEGNEGMIIAIDNA